MGCRQRELDKVNQDTCHISFIVRHRDELISELCGNAAVSCVVVLLIFALQPIIPTSIRYTGFVFWCIATIGITTIARAKVSAEGTAGGCCGDSLARVHVAELRTAAEHLNMAVCDGRGDITLYGFGGIEATAIELIDVGMLNLPGDITRIVCTTGFTDTLHSRTGQHTKAASADIALSIVSIAVNIASIKSRKVELVIVTTRNRHRRVFGCALFILVSTTVELLEPDIATHMVVLYCIRTLSITLTYPLFHHTTLNYQRRSDTRSAVILELSDTEQRGIG